MSAGVMLFVLALLATLGGSLASAATRVVTSTSQIADIVRNVGGELVELKSLMGPGVDPHLYKATARDVIALQRADLILYNGLNLEGRLADTFAKINKKGRPVIAVAERVPSDRLLTSIDYPDYPDPHVWFDPELWTYAIDAVVDALAGVDAPNEAAYRQRGEEYKKQVQALVPWTRQRVREIPDERRVLITSHDAYSYFGRAFEVQVVGVQGISTVTEAGLADITKMADFIKERDIPAIFVESSVAPSTIRRISQDSGAVVGGELFSDALGAPGDLRKGSDGGKFDVGTYIGMFKYNVDTIAGALR